METELRANGPAIPNKRQSGIVPPWCKLPLRLVVSKTIELPDDVYRDLEKIAQEHGLNVAAYIAKVLPGRTGPATNNTDRRERALAWLRESGWHIGGPPYPSRDSLYDRLP